jgi:hypothetical protein
LVKLSVGKVPYPEAVMLVEETLVSVMVPDTLRFPAKRAVPVADTKN